MQKEEITVLFELKRRIVLLNYLTLLSLTLLKKNDIYIYIIIKIKYKVGKGGED